MPASSQKTYLLVSGGLRRGLAAREAGLLVEVEDERRRVPEGAAAALDVPGVDAAAVVALVDVRRQLAGRLRDAAADHVLDLVPAGRVHADRVRGRRAVVGRVAQGLDRLRVDVVGEVGARVQQRRVARRVPVLEVGVAGELGRHGDDAVALLHQVLVGRRPPVVLPVLAVGDVDPVDNDLAVEGLLAARHAHEHPGVVRRGAGVAEVRRGAAVEVLALGVAVVGQVPGAGVPRVAADASLDRPHDDGVGDAGRGGAARGAGQRQEGAPGDQGRSRGLRALRPHVAPPPWRPCRGSKLVDRRGSTLSNRVRACNRKAVC